MKLQNNSSDNENFFIINGPGKFEFIVESFCVNDKKRNEIIFLLKKNTGPIKFKAPQPMKVIINSISWEDGSGESWLFDGREACGGGKVGGYYNTSRHTGYIKII